MVLCEQPFQMNAVLFHHGLTLIQFTVYSYLKFCCGSGVHRRKRRCAKAQERWSPSCLQQVLSAGPERAGGSTVNQEMYV